MAAALDGSGVLLILPARRPGTAGGGPARVRSRRRSPAILAILLKLALLGHGGATAAAPAQRGGGGGGSGPREPGRSLGVPAPARTGHPVGIETPRREPHRHVHPGRAREKRLAPGSSRRSADPDPPRNVRPDRFAAPAG